VGKGGSKKQLPMRRITTDPPRKAVPAIAARPGPGFTAIDQRLFRVRWNKFDYHGPWCIGHSPSSLLVDLMTRIRDMEQMTPLQVFSGDPGKDYGDPAALPNKQARRRLEEIGLSDETNISRLRIGQKERLYGFRRDPEFYAVFCSGPDAVPLARTPCSRTAAAAGDYRAVDAVAGAGYVGRAADRSASSGRRFPSSSAWSSSVSRSSGRRR